MRFLFALIMLYLPTAALAEDAAVCPDGTVEHELELLVENSSSVVDAVELPYSGAISQALVIQAPSGMWLRFILGDCVVGLPIYLGQPKVAGPSA